MFAFIEFYLLLEYYRIMSNKRGFFLLRIIPKTLLGRIFWGTFFVSFASILIIGSWFYFRVYSALDNEATSRLGNVANLISINVKTISEDQTSDVSESQRFDELSGIVNNSGGWLQNIYWIDLSKKKPRFIASFSANIKNRKSMVPPTAEEAEDIIYDHINDLERGEIVFPDPYSYSASRRFKMVLIPFLDSFQMLDTVVGIEADMQYLNIFMKLRGHILEALLLTFFLSILISFVLASNLNSKILSLLKELSIVEEGKIPEINDLRVQELNMLQKGIVELGQRIEDRKIQLKEVYESKFEDLSLMGGAIAHEIRNPLSAIEMHFGLIRRVFKKAEIAEPESVFEVAEQLNNLKALIEKFLSYTRRIETELEKIPFKEAIEQVAKSINCEGKWSFKVDAPETETVLMDKSMFKQIFENLFKNSIEASTGEIEIKASLSRKENVSIIRFADNGTGIPENVQKQLFMPFITGKKNGNGIGLTLIRKFVEAHRGKIYLDDKTDSGTVFVIEVPKNENPDC